MMLSFSTIIILWVPTMACQGGTYLQNLKQEGGQCHRVDELMFVGDAGMFFWQLQDLKKLGIKDQF